MSRVRRDIEAMADLLLGPSPTVQPDRVVALIDGNLPSRGDAWRAAAADLVIGTASGMLLQSRFGELDTLAFNAPPGPVDDLQGVIESAPPGHAWVVSTGSAVDGRLLTGADEITLLTGVDEAAVVAGYGLLKRLLLERPGPTPVVSLVLAGTDSLEAGDRFVRTARAKLGVEPRVAGCLPTLGRQRHAWRRMPLPEGGMCTVLATLVAAAGSRAAAQVAEPAVGPAPVAAAPMEFVAAAPPQPAPQTPATAPTQAQAPPAAAMQSPGGVPLPAGFTVLAITCPLAPRVVFATDQAGAVHALCPAALLADLVAALGWAAAHGAMLPGPGQVQGHVLVGDVASAAALQAAPWPVHLVVDTPQGPKVLPAHTPPLSNGPAASTVPGWPTH